MMYVSDYDGRFPDTLMGRDTGDSEHYFPWTAVLMPYVQNRQVFVCPSAGWGSDQILSWRRIQGGYGAVRQVLGYNGSLAYNAADWGDDPDPSIPGRGVLQGDMTEPANNILAIDGSNYYLDRGFWERTDNTSHPTARIAELYNNAYYVVDSRHNNMANAVYADGHARALPRGLQNIPRPHDNPIAGAGPWRSYHFH